ncbi:hypothetical protein [Alloactinosynnema sp. L-07]|uniref:hypothetical protein n=1 Tax=Alloactinosynnema sp. L-07 TaxID=1653480 RepID=UPI00065EF528|nr:hypothetical protein [Alloactinosynnema sp. L-07]CRK60610.1 hypothetical protein [Alloactinosynnema sp. L-07]
MGEADRWRWRMSGYDDRVHAFPSDERPASFVEAACTHSVPFGKIRSTHEGPRCLACLLIIGDRLAEQHSISAFDQ